MNYQDILKEIEGSGTYWSPWDLDTAKAHPEFGTSMLSYKQDWANATDQAGRQAANMAAEQLRKQYGSYTGGTDGSKYYGMGPAPGGYQSGYMDRLNELMGQLPGYQSGYQSRLDDVLSKMENYGDFDYGPAPTYDNRYQAEIDSLLDQVQGYGPFSWSKEEDPAYSAYAKQYRREGDRATQEAMARAAAASGGQISTAAMTAASQAGDYYAGQLADKIPELYQNAYQRYLSDYQLLADKLGQTQGAEQMDYAKFRDQLSQYNQDRAQSYDQWLQGYNMLGQNFSALQGMDQRDYGRLLDQIQLNQGLDETGYGRYLDQIQHNQNQQSLYQQQVDAILQAGGTPSAGLIGDSGYSNEYINALQNFYAQQEAEKVKGNGGGPKGGSDTADIPALGTDAWMEYIASEAAAAGQAPTDYMRSHKKELGITDGMIKEYAGRIDTWSSETGGLDPYGSGMDYKAFSAAGDNVYRHLLSGNGDAAIRAVNEMWSYMDAAQRKKMTDIMAKFGYQMG